MLTTSFRRVGIATVLLYAAIIMSMVMLGRPLPGTSVVDAKSNPTAAQWQCTGTKFFNSAGVGATFTTGSMWKGGTFWVENNNFMEVRNNPESGFQGYIVGEFDQPKLNGDTATITFNRQIKIVSVYNWDNDPKAGEAGWSFQGTPLAKTGDKVAKVTQWNETTNTVTFSSGDDSGGIDFCFIETTTTTGGQGCTPGYWKQPHHFDSWTSYTQNQDYETVFGVDASFNNTTLLGALQQGGGGEMALGRHAVAALLNTASGGVNYAYTTAEVIALVQQAYATGNIEGVKNILAAQNEKGCPLN